MTKDIVDRLRDAADACPEDIFPAPSKLQLEMHPEVITRASASMGRHFSPMLAAAADEIDRLRKEAEMFRFLATYPNLYTVADLLKADQYVTLRQACESLMPLEGANA